MTEAIIYTRFSPRPNAKECDSCERQHDRCLMYLAGKGLLPRLQGDEILHFSDEGVSGDKLPREGLSAALGAIKPGYVFIVDKSNRLARDAFVNSVIRREIEKRGGILEYADGTPPATTPEGKLFQGILALFDEYELTRIRLNTKRGIARNRALGKKINGNIPTGMMEDLKNPGMLVKCPKEREGIIRACRWRRKYNRDEIARWLTIAFRVGPYRGKPWSGRLVDKIIARHSYWADPADGDLQKEPEFF